MSETTTMNDAKLADLLLATIHSELALGFDFLKLDVGAMETEALAEHVAKRVRALLAAGTPQPTACGWPVTAGERGRCILPVGHESIVHRAANGETHADPFRAVVPPPPEPTSCPHMATGMCSTCWEDYVPPLIGLPVPPPPDTAAAPTDEVPLVALTRLLDEAHRMLPTRQTTPENIAAYLLASGVTLGAPTPTED
jgi:hypothetical protein